MDSSIFEAMLGEVNISRKVKMLHSVPRNCCFELHLLNVTFCFCFYPKTGNQILSLGSLSKDQMYPMKLKGISICYSALKSALCGNYVSFGVFKLYGDNHFDNALQAFVKMLLTVPHSDLLVSHPASLEFLCETWSVATTDLIVLPGSLGIRIAPQRFMSEKSVLHWTYRIRTTIGAVYI